MPRDKKYIGLDLGSVTCGVSRSDTGRLAQPVRTIRFHPDDYDEAIDKILEQESGIKVVLQDERNTTKDSEEFLIMANVSRKKRKKVIDQQAAVRILQYYLDSHKNEAS